MRTLTGAALAALLVAPAAVSAADWKEQKGDHFIVYYVTGEDFAKAAGRKAETYYGQIADDLGYPRYSNFWQWEKRVKIYVHPAKDVFRSATGEPEWSEGMANYTKKEIHTYGSAQGFLDGILPHEITHLIFRDFVGLTGAIPLWMDEGVAQWEEPGKRALAKQISRYLIDTSRAWSVAELTRMDIRSSTDAETANHFYMQSVCLVDFLIKTYGPQSFTEFCRQLRDNKTLEEAMRSAYSNSIASLAELDARWRKYALS